LIFFAVKLYCSYFNI